MKKFCVSLCLVIAGLILVLAGLWGGAYAQFIWYRQWQAFPAFATAFLTIFAGGVVFIVGICSLESKSYDDDL